MSLGAKVALGLAIVVALGIVVSATAAATAVYRAGMMSVSVQEKGDHGVAISLGVPVILMQAGMVFVPEEAWADARRESEQWWPLIEAGIAGLEDAPDGTYVAVDNATGEGPHLQGEWPARHPRGRCRRHRPPRHSGPIVPLDRPAPGTGSRESPPPTPGRPAGLIAERGALQPFRSWCARLIAASMPRFSRTCRTSAFCFGVSCRM